MVRRRQSQQQSDERAVAWRALVKLDVVPAQAGTHNHRLAFGARWVPAFVFDPGGLFGRNRCRPRHLVYQGAPRVMELNLHANATTTPKIRAYIQRSKKPVAELSAE